MTAAFRALLSAPMSGSRPSLKHVSASRNACGRVSSTSFPARLAYFSTRYPSSINPAIMSLASLLLAYGQYWFTVIFCWRARAVYLRTPCTGGPCGEGQKHIAPGSPGGCTLHEPRGVTQTVPGCGLWAETDEPAARKIATTRTERTTREPSMAASFFKNQ